MFGKDALELVEGKTGFAVKDGKLVMSNVADMHADMMDSANGAADEQAAAAE